LTASVNCSVILHSFNTRGGIIYYPGGIIMKRRSNGRKSLIAILSLSVLLVPVTSTISKAQGKSVLEAGQAGKGGTSGINKAAAAAAGQAGKGGTSGINKAAAAAAGQAGKGGTAGIAKAIAAAGQAGAGGTVGMSTAAIVGISAAVVAAGATIAVAVNDDASSSSAHHHH
jgi:hypothetical protein